MARRRFGVSSRLLVPIVAVASMVTLAPTASGGAAKGSLPKPRIIPVAAFDVSAPLRELAARASAHGRPLQRQPDPGPIASRPGHSPDGALQSTSPARPLSGAAGLRGAAATTTTRSWSCRQTRSATSARTTTWRWSTSSSPSTPETGTSLLGPTEIGTLWAGFAIDDCTDMSGDPIVVYDQLADRWILTQLTTSGLDTGGDLLQLRRGLDHRRPDRHLLPVRVLRHGTATSPTTRSTGSGRTPTSSPPASSRRTAPSPAIGRVRPGAEQDAARQPGARAVGFLLARTRSRSTPGDGLLPSDLDGKPIAAARDHQLLRRNPGRRGPLRRAVRRHQHLRAAASSGARPDAPRSSGPTQLPVAEFDSTSPAPRRVPRLHPAARAHDPMEGSTSCPTGSDRPGGWPTATSAPRGAGHQPVGRGAPGRRRRPLVRDPADRRARTRSISRARTRPTTASTAGWAASPWTRRATWRSGTACQRHERLPGDPLHRAARPTTRSGRCPRAKA